ncbi:DNA-3-methyladenine glycosylase family protein [Nocardioides ultimimeridianus]
MALLIERVGRPDPFDWPGNDIAPDLFSGLVLHIVGQQISIPAALAVFTRLTDAAGSRPMTAEHVADLEPEDLRSAGLSGAKARAIHELAVRVAHGTFDLGTLRSFDDAGARTALLTLRGIGPWSADMFLIHQLHRPDVLPIADVGLQRAVHVAWNLPTRPTPAELDALASRWTPWRSYAASLLWASLDH